MAGEFCRRLTIVVLPEPNSSTIIHSGTPSYVMTAKVMNTNVATMG
jgi:hypothetical protein